MFKKGSENEGDHRGARRVKIATQMKLDKKESTRGGGIPFLLNLCHQMREMG
jgi:hypothetical protein